MRAPAENDAAKRRHVTEVATPCNGDVVGTDSGIVRRIELDPAERRAEHANPGVGCATTDGRGAPTAPAGSARRGATDVAADVTRGEPARTQTGNHEVCEVLADSAPVREHFAERCRDGRCAWGVAQLAVQLRHESFRAGEDRALACEALLAVVRERALHAHVLRLVPEPASFQRVARGPMSAAIADRKS